MGLIRVVCARVCLGTAVPPHCLRGGAMYFNVYGEKVSRKRYREMVQAGKNRRELISANLTSRRDLMKLGLLTAGGMLAAKSGLSARAYGQQQDIPPSGSNQVCLP